MKTASVLTASALLIVALAIVDTGRTEMEKTKNDNEYNELTEEEKRVIIDKGTEKPFTGEYNKHYEKGAYTCRRCGALLYRSEDKFDSGCGWPSFDDEVPGAVERSPDPDGRRTEITCANCGGHLGHVFEGERLTDKNVRHCVNSISMDFVPEKHINEAYFAGGCFWGVEYYLEELDGVMTVVSGYMGGHAENPSYGDVSSGGTGHAETVRVVYDDRKTGYEKLAREFFEIHDPTQKDRQGPDIGSHYRSVIFYDNDEEKAVAEKLIHILESKGYDIATEVKKAGEFYRAEDYHQDYYSRTGKTPYCHAKTERF